MFFKKKREKTDIKKLIDTSSLRHIAFIMDGNGRWATSRSLPREAGHKVGAQTFENVVRYCGTIGIRYVTVYAFSTENWKRPEKEVNAIMQLLDQYIARATADNDKNKTRFRFIGDMEALPPALAEKCRKLEKFTADNEQVVNIALNYGGRAEIVHAANEAVNQGEPITEETVSAHLYTADCPEPDMIVRTGGETRLSNFLMWQSAYSELYFSKKLWPDFSTDDVDEAIEEFSKRKRRYGGI